MNGFGKIKTKILKKLVESYSSDNKNDVKDIIKTLKSNKEFKELYPYPNVLTDLLPGAITDKL